MLAYGENGYIAALRTAYDVIRRYGDGRYSSRSLVNISNAADEAAALEQYPNEYNAVSRNIITARLPHLLRATLPSSYDEETEVKFGGVVSAAVVFPANDNKTLLAVSPGMRKKGIGSAMLVLVNSSIAPPVCWVHRTNSGGQQFLLRNGYAPSTITTGGAVRYTLAFGRDEEEVA